MASLIRIGRKVIRLESNLDLLEPYLPVIGKLPHRYMKYIDQVRVIKAFIKLLSGQPMTDEALALLAYDYICNDLDIYAMAEGDIYQLETIIDGYIDIIGSYLTIGRRLQKLVTQIQSRFLEHRFAPGGLQAQLAKQRFYRQMK